MIYLLTTYIYFFIWFIFITIRFATAYKQKVFDSILTSKLGVGFMGTFGRCDYTIQSRRENEKHKNIFQRLYLDLIGNDERIKTNNSIKNKTIGYKFKLIITNLFYILLAIVLGRKEEEFYFWEFVCIFLLLGFINWMILSSCDKPTVDCHQSLIYLAFINRLMPYAIVILTQIEQYKYLSYKLDVVGIRFVFKNMPKNRKLKI